MHRCYRGEKSESFAIDNVKTRVKSNAFRHDPFLLNAEIFRLESSLDRRIEDEVGNRLKTGLDNIGSEKLRNGASTREFVDLTRPDHACCR